MLNLPGQASDRLCLMSLRKTHLQKTQRQLDQAKNEGPGMVSVICLGIGSSWRKLEKPLSFSTHDSRYS